MKTIISIVGFAGAGKNTFANAFEKILSKHRKNVKIMAFADRPKEMFAQLSNCSTEDLFKKIKDKNQNRRALVTFAEGMKEVFGKEVWANSLVNEINLCPAEFIIVSDLRFLEEQETLNNSNAAHHFTVRIVRKEVIPSLDLDSEWYVKGMMANVLTTDQHYQHYNAVQPNPMARTSMIENIMNDNKSLIDEKVYEWLVKNFILDPIKEKEYV